MKIELKPFQDSFLFDVRRYPAMVCAIGTGKTLMLLLKIWKYCKDYPNTLALIVRKEYTDLRDCFAEGTEILTDSGWKDFSDLNYSDKVLSNHNGKAEYTLIDKIIAEYYEGDMYAYDHRGLTFCVTPNHQFPIKTPSGLNGKKAKTPDWKMTKVRDIRFKLFFLKRDMEWKGKEQEEISFISTKGSAKSWCFKMDDWLAFLGWFISEGNTYKHKTKKTHWISISQSSAYNQKNCQEIASLFKRMRLPSRLYSGNKFVFGSRAIAEHLNLHCNQGASRKKVPDYVKELSPRQIKIFLDAYNKGDGYILGNSRRYNTTSKRLADDIQELILKSGGYARIVIRDIRGRKSWIEDHWATTNHLDYLIIEYSKRKSYDIGIETKEMKKIPYKGMIYCVDTKPNHSIYVRKNGACFWSGNSTLKDVTRYFGVTVDSNKEYKFPNGSVVMFRHGAELNVLKNINLSIFGIEQAEEFVTEEVFIFLRDRLRRDNAPYRQGCIIANTNGHNWIWKLWKNNPTSKEYSLIEANTFDNADNLPVDFINDLKQMAVDAPNHYKRYVMNSWEDAEGEDYLFKWDSLNRSSLLILPKMSNKTIIGVDVARFGDNETVFQVIRDTGNSRWEHIHQEAWHGKDIAWIAGHYLSVRREFHAHFGVIDDVGLGGGVVDILRRDRKMDIVSFISNSKPKNEEMYMYLRDEAYFNLKWMIDNQMLKILDEQELIDQLLTIRFAYRRGKKVILSKDEMRKEGIKSPDRADALMMAMSQIKKAITINEMMRGVIPAKQIAPNAGFGFKGG